MNEALLKTSDLLNKSFSKEEIDHFARDSGFLMRKRKLTGSSFIDLLVYNQHSLARQSLNDTCVTYLKRYNKELSKQALAQRFNDKAIGFLKLVIGQLIQKQVNTSNLQWHKLLHFKRVLIKDSTCFQVDQTLCQYFPGSGGSSSKAAVRIQFGHDVMCGEITELEIVPFNNQDLKNARETVGQLDEGTLVIRDLGYVSTEVLHGTDHAGAFFLCRLPPHKKIYEKIDGKAVEVNFSKVITHLKKNDKERVVKQVYLCKNM